METEELASLLVVPGIIALIVYLIIYKVIFTPKNLLAKVGAHAPFKEVKNEGFGSIVVTGKDDKELD